MFINSIFDLIMHGTDRKVAQRHLNGNQYFYKENIARIFGLFDDHLDIYNRPLIFEYLKTAMETNSVLIGILVGDLCCHNNCTEVVSKNAIHFG